ncbi:hypothetical protein BKA63DRAFT_262882 [Paraphoma chrysanthemicola]|nr:hypothetical protein BKA63DRAFT_262882 [Paraphoma chrysanthemicola]
MPNTPMTKFALCNGPLHLCCGLTFFALLASHLRLLRGVQHQSLSSMCAERERRGTLAYQTRRLGLKETCVLTSVANCLLILRHLNTYIPFVDFLYSYTQLPLSLFVPSEQQPAYADT